MSKKKIQKSFSDYITKIKSSPHSQIHLPSKKWILSGCKHPKTPSFSLDDKKNESSNNDKKDDATALADIDRFLFENFKSLYFKDDEETNTNMKKVHTIKRVSKEESNNEDIKSSKLRSIFLDDTTIDMRDSSQFFMTQGFLGDDEAGSSSTSATLTDSSPSSHLFYSGKGCDHDCDRDHSYHANRSDQIKDHDRDHNLPNNSVVVLASSESPYDDFKCSMQGMVDARLRNNEEVNWDFMEDLLFCHLNLNEKKSHKFILSAFVDLISTMRGRRLEDSSKEAMKPRSVRTVRIGREVRKKTKEVTLEFE